MNEANGARGWIRGFTLVELMVSVILFTIIIIFGMSFFSAGERPFMRAKKAMFAVTLGSGMMEQYKTWSWDDLVSTTTTAVDPKSGTTFTNTVEVKTVTIGSAQFKYIGSTVTWPEQHVAVDFVTARSTTVVD